MAEGRFPLAHPSSADKGFAREERETIRKPLIVNMRKFLSRIFSAVLLAAVAVVPVAAQHAKKQKAPAANQKKIEAVAQRSSLKKSKGKNNFNPFAHTKKKSVASRNLSKARTGMQHAVRANRPVLKEEGSLPEILGSVIYSDNEDFELGLYNVPLTADDSFALLAEDYGASGGAVILDGVYYETSYVDYWGYQFVYVLGIDIASGETVYEVDSEMSSVSNAGYAFDPITQRVYGFFVNDTLDGYEFGYIEFNADGPVTTYVAPIPNEIYYTAISIASDGTIYALRNNYDETGLVISTTLCTIDRTTAEATEIGTTNLTTDYLTGAVIDLTTDRMFWAYSTDSEGGVAEVDLTTGATTVIHTFEAAEEVTGLAIAPPAAEDAAPAECTNLKVEFPNGGLTGTISFNAPAALFDGSAAQGTVTVKVLANGEEVASKDDVNYGEAVTFPLDMSTTGAGLYTFTVYALNTSGAGPRANLSSIFVGVDTPAATTATLKYTNGNMELSWLPVTATVNGGYMDTDALTYTVKRADGSVAVSGLTATSFSEAVAEPADIASYYYTVYAECGGFTSAPARSNTVVLGSIVPPYTSDYYSNDNLDGFTIIDSADDGSSWKVYTDYVRCLYSTDNPKDDWLITPPLKLEGGKAYLLSFDAWAESAMYDEQLEVMWGNDNTVAAMTNTVLPLTSMGSHVSGNHLQVAKYITPEEDGIYFIGFHAASEADMYYLNLSNFTIETGVASDAPAAVSGLTAVSDASGALAATVSFTAPSTNLSGAPISELTKIEVYRGETLVKTFDAPTPGEALSFTDTLDAKGEVTYRVVAYNGLGAGAPEEVSLYVGVYLPLAPVTAHIERTATAGQALISWDAVTHDVNGVAIAPGQVVYDVYKFEGYSRVAIATGLSATSYTANLVDAGKQELVQCLVFARTDAGEGDGQVTEMIPVGTPYPGLQYSFPDGVVSDQYVWGILDIEGENTVSTFTSESGIPASDGDNGFIGVKGNYIDDSAMIFTGLISLEGMVNPGLTFYVYNLVGDAGPSANQVQVCICTSDNADWTEVFNKSVAEICGNEEGWYRVTVPLSDYAGKTIQVGITSVVNMYAYTFYDNIRVASLIQHDLVAASIQAPSKVAAGADYKVDVTVANEGTDEATGYSVKLYRNDELVETSEGAALASGDSKQFTFDMTMDPTQEDGVEYFAVVEYAPDQNVTNNQTSTVTVTPVASLLPPARNLEAVNEDADVKLTWEAPDFNAAADRQPVTFDFEDGDAFSATYGDWTFVDGDKSEVGGFQTMQLPGIEVGETKGSFWIWDNDVAQGNATFDAHSGTHYLFSLFRYDDGQVDDWAISPLLSGKEQTVSFYAKSYSAEYPETIEIYYSTGSTDTRDFVAVTGVADTNPVPQEWTLYEFKVPEGAQRFAIRSHSVGAFMLMIDDVTFTPGVMASAETLKGYDIYRNGVKLNIAPVENCEYVDSDVVDGEEYTYCVVAVYENGISSPSNSASLRFTSGVDALNAAVGIVAAAGKIVVTNADGLDVTVIAANGAVVYAARGEARTEIAVPAGVYVVKAGTIARKLAVK